jgi:hypothetical protein
MSTARQKALEAKLTVKQREAALLCVERELAEDTESRLTYDEIADRIGYSRKELWKWRTQNKAFIEYVNLLCDDFLESKRAIVYRQLMKLIEGSQPSVKGIDLYLRRHGLLTERQVVETKDGGSSRSNEDIAKDLEELDDLLTGDDANESDN